MINVDLTQLREWSRAWVEAPERMKTEMVASMTVALFETVTTAKGNAPYKDGGLRANIRILDRAQHKGSQITGRVGTDLEYSAMREYGGVIHARNKPYLVFQVNGQWVKKKSVRQTGSFYMQRTEEKMQERAPAIFQFGVDRALKGVAG